VSAGADEGRLVARVAGMSLLAKAGKLITPVSFLVFARLYGVEHVGVVLFLWGYTQLATRLVRFGIGTAVQRYAPAATAPAARAALLRFALLWVLCAGAAFAALSAAFAGPLAIALTTRLFESQRAGIAIIIAFLAGGMALMIGVREERGAGPNGESGGGP